MAFNPTPCPGCGGGTGGAGADVEQTLLCDVGPDGAILGTALMVQEYDSTGAPVGAPVPTDPATGLPYVVQGVLRPCDTSGHTHTEILCDVQADNSQVVFKRIEVLSPANTVVDTVDVTLDGAPYAATGTVGLCDPYANCTPTSNQDLNADCGPGQTVSQQVLLDSADKPLANSVFNDDATADPLCGGQWDRPADDLPAGFPVAESFRNTTFDQPGPVTQGNPATLPFLTAGPPTNDGAGAGWLRLSDGSYGSNGIWQVPAPFSTSQGLNAAVTLASHDGTTPGGDGQYFVFTDGAAPVQGSPIGGFGNLGLNNWSGGVFAVVLDEYGQSCTCGQALPSDPNPGPCGFCSNTISIQRAGASRVGASCACCTVAQAPLNPKAMNLTTRAAPVRLLVSVIEEAGQTYVSASLDWNDGNGPIQYFDRVNITACITVPPTLRMGLSMNSGGSFQAIKEARDAVARPAGVSNWRAFPITTDAIPACTTLVNVSASVDVTFADDGTQTAGNNNPEAYFYLVNTVTGAILASDRVSALPSQLGQVQNLTVAASVPPADVPNLRVYVGAESRDESGEYDSLWENLEITATGTGCPATPRRTLEISARCPIPVAIVSGGSGGPGGGGTTIVNTPSTFEDEPICATVGGVPQTAFRREVRAPDGSVTVTFLGFNGLGITPDSWVPGPCPAEVDQTLGPVCFQTIPPGPSSQDGFLTLDQADQPVLYDALGALVPAGTYTIVICPLTTQQSHVLCDAGNAGHQFLRWYRDSPIAGQPGTQWNFELDGSTPYVPVGPVGLCGDTQTGSVAEMILCDNFTVGPNNVREAFVRKFFQDATGAVTSIVDLTLLGTPYVVQGTVGDCSFTDPTFGYESICYTLTATGATIHAGTKYHQENFPAPGFLVFDTNGVLVNTGAGGYTQVPCIAASAAASDTRDSELQVLCDSSAVPVRFLRRYVLDGEDASVVSVINTQLDGVTPFVPTGAVGICTQAVATDFDFTVSTLCDSQGTPFLQRLTFNSSTGAVTSTTNTTLTGAPFVPVGAVTVCANCCPIVMGQGCTNTGSGTYVAIRAANGTISLLDAVTGAPVTGANIIACPTDNVVRTLTSQARLLTNAAPWTPGADVVGTLTSLTVTGLTGLWDMVDQNGTALVGLPAGLTLTWTAEDDNVLTGPTSVTPQAGASVVANWTVR